MDPEGEAWRERGGRREVGGCPQWSDRATALLDPDRSPELGSKRSGERNNATGDEHREAGSENERQDGECHRLLR